MAIHKKKPQAALFEGEDAALLDPSWKQEWQSMPEFIQEDATSWHSLVVHFRNADDLRAFGELLGQKIGFKPKALWFPAAEIGRIGDKRYVDES